MKKKNIWPIFLLVLIVSFCIVGCSVSEKRAPAESAVQQFHSNMNSEDFETIYLASHADFKQSEPKEKIIAFLQVIRTKLGKVEKTTQTNWRVNSFNLRTEVILVYTTDFEMGTGIETFTYLVEDGNALLRGYNINSHDLIMK